MRAKDLDEVLPNTQIDVDETSVTIDGSRTTLVNGTITQNGMELEIRMRRVGKALIEGADRVKAVIDAAALAGTPVQDGNRTLEIKDSKGRISYKDEYVTLLKAQGLEEADIKAYCEALTYQAEVIRMLEEQGKDPKKYLDRAKARLPVTKKVVIK